MGNNPISDTTNRQSYLTDYSAAAQRLNNVKGVRQRILGMPPRYTPVADMGRRAYEKTVLADFPILNITPGILKYRSQINVAIREIRNLIASDLFPIETDGRKVYFKYAYPEYARYLGVIASNVFNRMMNTGSSNAVGSFKTIGEMLELDNGDTEFTNDEVYNQEYEKFGGEVKLESLQNLVQSMEAEQRKHADEAVQSTQEAGSAPRTELSVNVPTNTTATSAGSTPNYNQASAEEQYITDQSQQTANNASSIIGGDQELPDNAPIQSPSIRTYGLSFYVDASTVANDSVDNSYTESELERNAKQLSDSMREMRFSMSNKNIFGKVTDAVMKLPEILKGGVGVFTTPGAVSAIMKGAKMTFPKVFEDNNFSRSYSISFKFVSPYGDRFSIFQYVYLPMLSLLCFVLPRQLSINSYISPFLVKMDYPGNFAVDMGVITRMSIDKAGDSSSWSIDGLPLQLNVTIDVMDLFPVLMMARNGKLINQSVSMAVYLNNMAGLSMTVDNPIERFFEGRYNRFMTRIHNLRNFPSTTVTNVKKSWGFQLGSWFSN